MTCFIDDIEFSVRASNVLRRLNPGMTFNDFMALTKKDVMEQKNAGLRTWQEVMNLQTHFRYIALEEAETADVPPPVWSDGQELRDAAALAALPALIARHRADVPWCEVAPRAWAVADAFLAARETKENAK